MFMADTGSVEVSSYKQYIVQQLIQGNARSDGRLHLTDLRTPSILAEEDPNSSRRPSIHPSPASPSSSPSIPSSSSSSSSTHKNTTAPHQASPSSSICTDADSSATKEASTPQAARFKKSGRLLSRMYTDDRGTCIHCDVDGLFAPPPLHSRKEGRLTIHVACPFLRRHGREVMSGGGVDLLKRNNTILFSGDEDLGRRQLEGFLTSVLHRCVNMEQLCVIEGEACWLLEVTLTLWNVDGGLWGATLLTVVSALQQLMLPRALLPNGEVVEARQVQLTRTPMACTYGVLSVPVSSSSPLSTSEEDEKENKKSQTLSLLPSASGTSNSSTPTTTPSPNEAHADTNRDGKVLWLADPTAAEEMVVDGHLTVTLDEKDGIVEIRQIGSAIQGLQKTILHHWKKAHKERRRLLGWNVHSKS